MKDLLHLRATQKDKLTRELATTLSSSLDRKYSQVFQTAQAEWDRRFAGKDPSDACVSVRIAPRATGTRGNPFGKAA